MRSIAFARGLCEKDLQVAVAKGADFLVHQVLDRMFENHTPATLDRIFTLKRDVMQLRRICTPEREILHRLSRGSSRW
jgi:Mg2+ and Co2+ transporter CorA